MKWLALILIFFLSLFDAICTWIGVSSGKFVEINPIMRQTLEWAPAWFFVIKQGMVLGICVFLAKFWGDIRSRYTVAFILGMYSLLALMHVLMFLHFGV